MGLAQAPQHASGLQKEVVKLRQRMEDMEQRIDDMSAHQSGILWAIAIFLAFQSVLIVVVLAAADAREKRRVRDLWRDALADHDSLWELSERILTAILLETVGELVGARGITRLRDMMGLLSADGQRVRGAVQHLLQRQDLPGLLLVPQVKSCWERRGRWAGDDHARRQAAVVIRELSAAEEGLHAPRDDEGGNRE
jgi:hypothetical protein